MLIVSFSGFALSQSSGSVDPGTNEEQIALKILNVLGTEVSKRVSPATPRAFVDNSFRIAFLYDNAAVEMRNPYKDFVSKVIFYMSKNLEANQRRFKKVENPYLLSRYPYQLNLYTTEMYALEDVPVRSGVPEQMQRVLIDPLGRDADGWPINYRGSDQRLWSGHDNISSRQQLFQRFANRNDNRPLLVVQFTRNKINVNRRDKAIHAIVSKIGTNEVLVHPPQFLDAGYDAYGELIEDARPTAPGEQRVTTFIWLYGPRQISGLARIGLVGPHPPGGFPFWVWALVVGVAVAGVAAWWFSGRVTITIEGTPKVLKRGGELTIVAPGGKQTSGTIFELSANSAAGAPSGALASIAFSLDVAAVGRACAVSASAQQARTKVLLKRGKEQSLTLSAGTYSTTIKLRVS